MNINLKYHDYQLLVMILNHLEKATLENNLKLGIKRVIEMFGNNEVETNKNGGLNVVINLEDNRKIQQVMVVLNRLIDTETIKMDYFISYEVADNLLSKILIQLYEYLH